MSDMTIDLTEGADSMQPTYETNKQELMTIAKTLVTACEEAQPDLDCRRAVDLIADMQADIYTIVVLGEFSRGKSTFINALLGEALLPVDVTPTTAAIHALMYDEQERVIIHYTDGTTEEQVLSKASLERFVAEEVQDPSSIAYVTLAMPNDALKGRMALVDTPGVDDLNQQRADVTYQFIPRADAVLFLLDATTALRRTEQQFITDSLLDEGRDRILFLANFMDELEDDEAGDAIDQIQRRLSAAIGTRHPVVLPLSAKKALEGQANGDEEQIDASGIGRVRREMRHMIDQGSSADAKLMQFQRRLQAILNDVKRQLEAKRALETASKEELEDQLALIQATTDRLESIEESIKDYVTERKEDMAVIIQKSVRHFSEDLKEDVMTMVEDYEGVQFKSLIEKQVPSYVKKRMKQWIEQYTPNIHQLFEMLEREMAIGLATEFNTSITRLQGKRSGLVRRDGEALQLSPDDLSNTPVMAGIFAGGAGALAMVLGGPILLPIVGMAGYPMIQKMLMESKLEQAKQDVLPVLDDQLQEIFDRFYLEIDHYVEVNTEAIYRASLQRFEELSMQVKDQVERELADKEQSDHDLAGRLAVLNKTQELIGDLEDQLYQSFASGMEGSA